MMLEKCDILYRTDVLTPRALELVEAPAIIITESYIAYIMSHGDPAYSVDHEDILL